MAHVLLFPFPAQGHVPPFLKLAELLSRAGLFITFVNTEHAHRRFLASSPTIDRLAGLQRFRFRTIPDGLGEEDPRLFVHFLRILESLRTRSREHYRELLAPEDGHDPDGWPPVTCVVGDGMLSLALEVAEEMDVPVMLLRTSSACSVWAYYSIPKLVETGDIPFPEKADMDELVQGVAGMESFLRRRDLPGLTRHAKSVADPTLKFLMTASENLARGRALIMNTAECLESPVLSHLSSICRVIYTVGPLQTLLQNFGSCRPDQDVSNSTAASNSASLWQEDRSCLKWLDSHPNKSVVYVSFGSVTVVSREALVEFWHGLVGSGRPFLWVIRPDMVEAGDETAPAELETAARERGCLVAWAPQEEVLAHPSVGCFLTHSGWNSTLESIVAGVPMICWPFFADQQVNSRFVGEVWKVGVDMKDLCGRSVVEGMVRKVMDGGEVGEELRKSAAEMSHMVRIAAEEGGSSYTNFQKLVDHIKSLSSQKYQGSSNK
ncbi:7-deoxyloganetic acid glucosyltransferase-like [Iris pallida]|uniref:Glycosyltransferase n=1 Tax=Iris pallida TaxID=29817 RepID=A0AAX6GDB4_IRIPA|nr:7-deoxyloganetic acid glucosyltransferase-like [Iris pallida]